MTKGLLPLDARLMLQRAASTPVPSGDPLARIKAIEAATARIKRDYPYLFKEEEPDEVDGCRE